MLQEMMLGTCVCKLSEKHANRDSFLPDFVEIRWFFHKRSTKRYENYNRNKCFLLVCLSAYTKIHYKIKPLSLKLTISIEIIKQIISKWFIMKTGLCINSNSQINRRIKTWGVGSSLTGGFVLSTDFQKINNLLIFAKTILCKFAQQKCLVFISNWGTN